MAPLEDWARDALSPRYALVREVARGGMAIVYLAHDRHLEREVAVKVLPPAQATAASAEAFLREARILAGLSHPALVPVHDADEARGLFYYVMDFVASPTLAELLAAGPADRALAFRIGRDLLAALEVVHRAGILHRDVKPANIFVHQGRAMLADFGIAHQLASPAGSTSGSSPGTPAYMSPEQFRGDPVDERADLYAAAMVIYECFTAKRWPRGLPPADGPWQGVPGQVAAVLRRGLALDPNDRWPSARAFGRALAQGRVRTRRLVTAALVGAGAVGGAVALSLLRPGPLPPPADGIVVRVEAAVGEAAAVGVPLEGIAPLFARLLAGTPDFRVCAPGERCPSAQVEIHPSVQMVEGRPLLRVEHRSRGAVEVVQAEPFDPADWTVAVDRASNASLRSIWSSTSPLARWLPIAALPESDAGYEAWLAGEVLWRRASWQAAREAFERAVAIDSSCLLCSWRVTEAQRWLMEAPDPVHFARVARHRDAFPPHYQPLIEWRFLPVAERIATLEEATRRWPGFPPLWFALGEELYHRGPLAGRHRAEAMAPLRRAVALDPGSGPLWEELAWLSIAEGDRPAAEDALARYDSLIGLSRQADPYARLLQSLTHVGFAWRFEPARAAAGLAATLADPQVLAFPELGAGPRLLAEFEARQGMLALGAAIARAVPRSEVAFTARVAVLLAETALGRPADAARTLDTLERHHSELADVRRFRARFEAATALLDPASPAATSPATSTAAPADHLARVFGAAGDGAVAPEVARLVQAARLPPREALEAVGDLHDEAERYLRVGDSLAVRRLPDPFFRTMLRFLRAGWREQLGDRAGAAAELLFAEASDVTGFPAGLPQAADLDWAFSTLAHWRRAELLVAVGQGGEACGDLRAVSGRWAAGDALHQRRAEEATARLERLGCPVDREVAW